MNEEEYAKKQYEEYLIVKKRGLLIKMDMKTGKLYYSLPNVED